MKKTLYTILFAVVTAFGATAQVTPYDGCIAVEFHTQVMEGENVTFRADIDFTQLGLHTSQMIEFTPILRSTQTSHEERFAPVVITGRQRARVIERAELYGDYTRANEPSEIIVLKRKTDRTHEIALTVPFRKWMRYSELVLVETTTACCNLQQEYGAGVTSLTYANQTPYQFPAPYQPTFAVSYIEPTVEPVKVMSDTYSAQLQFQSGRSNLVQNYGNNSSVLNQVDLVIGNLKLDSLLTVKRIIVKGYASPEGGSASNMTLSSARAQAFVNYLLDKHSYRAADGIITAQGMGEDWDSLRKAIENSPAQTLTHAERDAIFAAIENNGTDDSKETAIKRLSGSKIWRTLLADYFPDLRRNEYTVEYEVRGLNAEEAKTLIWTRPQLLSLNEMFMVANLYDPASQEYKDVFHIAARIYPDSPVAQFNTAAMEVESGAYDSAISRLLRMETPEAWNNLGVAFWYKGDYDRAVDYFYKATNRGLDTALENLRQFSMWDEDKD